MTSSNFAETIIGEATIDSVSKLATWFNEKASGIAAEPTEVEGRVAGLYGQNVIINVGSSSGVRTCDRFELSSVLEEIRDPITKDVLDLKTEEFGELVVMEVRDNVSYGAFTGSRVPQAGDMALRRAR